MRQCEGKVQQAPDLTSLMHAPRGLKTPHAFYSTDLKWKTSPTARLPPFFFSTRLGWKKRALHTVPSLFSGLQPLVCGRSQFLKNLLEWLFYQQAGPLPSSSFWLVQEGGENKKTKQQGENVKKKEVQKEAEETAVGEVSWRFPAINFRLSRLLHLRRTRARGG